MTEEKQTLDANAQWELDAPHYLAYDVETGGIGLKYSLLTAYFAILTRDFRFIQGLDLVIKPNKGEPYIIDPGALAVNKINLIEHHKTAITYADAGTKLYEFLEQGSIHKVNKDDPKEKGMKFKLTPLGHHITSEEGDTVCIQEYLLAKRSWQTFVSPKVEDTLIIAEYLKTKGMIPMDMSTALHSLASFYNIPFPGQHTAMGDTLVTIEVRKRM